MQIEIKKLHRENLEDFADKHGLIMEVVERNPKNLGSRWQEKLRFYAHFKNCEIKEGPTLSSAYGDGQSMESAIMDYAKSISGALLVVNSFSVDRKEIQVPILHYFPHP